MAKPRKLKKKDKALTELLNMPGLTAIGGNEHDIEAMSPDTAMTVCAECGAVFQKPIEFVKENSKTTKRYEDEVLRHVMYESLDKAREDMADYIVHGCEDDLISKPAMSKLVKRWLGGGTVDKTVTDFLCTIPEMKLRINGSEDE